MSLASAAHEWMQCFAGRVLRCLVFWALGIPVYFLGTPIPLQRPVGSSGQHQQAMNRTSAKLLSSVMQIFLIICPAGGLANS